MHYSSSFVSSHIDVAWLQYCKRIQIIPCSCRVRNTQTQTLAGYIWHILLFSHREFSVVCMRNGECVRIRWMHSRIIQCLCAILPWSPSVFRWKTHGSTLWTGTGASACLRIAIQMECNEVYCVYLYFSRYTRSLSLSVPFYVSLALSQPSFRLLSNRFLLCAIFLRSFSSRFSLRTRMRLTKMSNTNANFSTVKTTKNSF